MNDVVLALLAIAIGALFCFRGYLTMRVVIPIWGAFTGFALGAGLVAGVTDDGPAGERRGVGGRFRSGRGVRPARLRVLRGLDHHRHGCDRVHAGLDADGRLQRRMDMAHRARRCRGRDVSGDDRRDRIAPHAVADDLVGVGRFIGHRRWRDAAERTRSTATISRGASVVDRIDESPWWWLLYFVLAVVGVASQMRTLDSMQADLREQWEASGGRELTQR